MTSGHQIQGRSTCSAQEESVSGATTQDVTVEQLIEQAVDRLINAPDVDWDAATETAVDSWLTSCSIIELAVRNPNVMEYMKHWEGRAERAEAERDAAVARAEVAEGKLTKVLYHLSEIEGTAKEYGEIACGSLLRRHLEAVSRAALFTNSTVERVQHIKRGTTYQIIARRKLQTDTPLEDYVELVAYRCEETGDVWFRPQSEFTPDRFAALCTDAKEV